MTTKQNEARRANAQKSTGPRTEAGKARSSMNALKTGIDAETLVLPNENPEAYQTVLTEWHEHYKPGSPATRTLVDRLATTEWFFRRYARLETTLISMYITDCVEFISKEFPDAHAFLKRCPEIARLQVRVNALDRTFHKDLDQLSFLQATEAQATEADLPVSEVEQADPLVASESPANSSPQPAEPTADNPSSASFLKTPPEAPATVPPSAPAAASNPKNTTQPVETPLETGSAPVLPADPLGKCA